MSMVGRSRSLSLAGSTPPPQAPVTKATASAGAHPTDYAQAIFLDRLRVVGVSKGSGSAFLDRPCTVLCTPFSALSARFGSAPRAASAAGGIGNGKRPPSASSPSPPPVAALGVGFRGPERTHARPPQVTIAALAAELGVRHCQGVAGLQKRSPEATATLAPRTAVVKLTPIMPSDRKTSTIAKLRKARSPPAFSQTPVYSMA